MYRNNPSGPYQVHLFEDDAVHEAGGPLYTDDRVESLCNWSETYGPLVPIKEAEGFGSEATLCATCLRIWMKRRNAAAEAEPGPEPEPKGER